MKRIFILFCFLSLFFVSHGSPSIYYVQFSDKQGTPYSLSKPEDFLSQRAIDRRQKWSVALDSTDLPVSPVYLNEIRLLGATVVYSMKWLNGAVVSATDRQAEDISALPFVRFVELTNPGNVSSSPKQNNTFALKSQLPHVDNDCFEQQLKQINLKALHSLGYKGDGIHIAVIDGGFQGLYNMAVFDSLLDSGRLLDYYDFVLNLHQFPDYDGSHGSAVMSLMASNVAGGPVGAAPNASYYCFRTENGDVEYRDETDYYCVAVERADSLGVDVITASLGYSVFDSDSMNYTYGMLDGNTTRPSRVASMAVEKGIFVLNAAGNEAHKPWHFISAPADGVGVMTVGAVDPDDSYAYFSSCGPSADGRIKPEIATCGYGVTVIGVDNNPYFSNGTSFATPIAAGMVASLMSALPHISPWQLFDDIIRNASNFDTPDDSIGYGIPDAFSVFSLYSSFNPLSDDNAPVLVTGDGGFYFENIDAPAHLTIYDISGCVAYADTVSKGETVSLPLRNGFFILQLNTAGGPFVYKLICR